MISSDNLPKRFKSASYPVVAILIYIHSDESFERIFNTGIGIQVSLVTVYNII